MTPQRIKEEANRAAESLPINTDGDVLYMVGYKEGHSAGATAEHDRAQVLVDALEEIINTGWHNYQAHAIAKKALAKWKGEVEENKPHSGNKHQWQDDWDMDEQGELNEETF